MIRCHQTRTLSSKVLKHGALCEYTDQVISVIAPPHCCTFACTQFERATIEDVLYVAKCSLINSAFDG